MKFRITCTSIYGDTEIASDTINRITDLKESEQAQDTFNKFISGHTDITIELDTDTQTARVIPVNEE